MNTLIDSDCLIAAFIQNDSNHNKAVDLMLKETERGSIYSLNLVIQESATVLSHKIGMEAAVLFIKKLQSLNLEIIDLDSSIEKEAWEIFLKQTKKGTSFIDCANLATANKYKLEKILSFDRFYKKHLSTV